MARGDRWAKNRQQYSDRVWLAIAQFWVEQRGVPPTFRQLADRTYMSRSSVTRWVDLLEAHGKLHRLSGCARNIRLDKWPIHLIEPPDWWRGEIEDLAIPKG